MYSCKLFHKKGFYFWLPLKTSLNWWCCLVFLLFEFHQKAGKQKSYSSPLSLILGPLGRFVGNSFQHSIFHTLSMIHHDPPWSTMIHHDPPPSPQFFIIQETAAISTVREMWPTATTSCNSCTRKGLQKAAAFHVADLERRCILNLYIFIYTLYRINQGLCT